MSQEAAATGRATIQAALLCCDVRAPMPKDMPHGGVMIVDISDPSDPTLILMSH